MAGEIVPEGVAAEPDDARSAADALEALQDRAHHRRALLAHRAFRRRGVVEIEVDLGRDGLAELGRPVVDGRAVASVTAPEHGAEPQVLPGQVEVLLDLELAARDLDLQRHQLVLRLAERADVLQLARGDARRIGDARGLEGARLAAIAAGLMRRRAARRGLQDHGAGGALLDPDVFRAHRIRHEQARGWSREAGHVVDLVDGGRQRSR
jgi:hypothetical protein